MPCRSAIQDIPRSGKMPPIEVGPARAITAISAAIARKAGSDTTPGANGVAAQKSPAPASTGPVATSIVIDPGQAPVDADRVAEIRKAVENGTYPILPTRIADAMIAAGIMLRSAKA
jgi:negative regulator of flagellin synthesis FlgM